MMKILKIMVDNSNDCQSKEGLGLILLFVCMYVVYNSVKKM